MFSFNTYYYKFKNRKLLVMNLPVHAKETVGVVIFFPNLINEIIYGNYTFGFFSYYQYMYFQQLSK